MPAVRPVLGGTRSAQHTLELCPEEDLLLWLLRPFQIGLGAQHFLQFAILAWQGVWVDGLFHNKDDITESFTNGSLLGKVELIVTPLTVYKML